MENIVNDFNAAGANYHCASVCLLDALLQIYRLLILILQFSNKESDIMECYLQDSKNFFGGHVLVLLERLGAHR